MNSNRRGGVTVKYVVYVVFLLLSVYALYYIHGLKTHLLKLEAKDEELSKKNEDLSDDNRSLEAELNGKKKEIEDLHGEHKIEEDKNLNEKKILDQQLDKLNSKHTTLKSQHEALEGEYSSLQDRYKKLEEDEKAEAKRHNEEYEKLNQDKNSEINQLKETIAKMQQDELAVQQKLNGMQAQQQELQSQLKVKIEEGETSIKQLTLVRMQLNEHKSHNKQEQIKINQLEEKLKDCQLKLESHSQSLTATKQPQKNGDENKQNDNTPSSPGGLKVQSNIKQAVSNLQNLDIQKAAEHLNVAGQNAVGEVKNVGKGFIDTLKDTAAKAAQLVKNPLAADDNNNVAVVNEVEQPTKIKAQVADQHPDREDITPLDANQQQPVEVHNDFKRNADNKQVGQQNVPDLQPVDKKESDDNGNRYDDDGEIEHKKEHQPVLAAPHLQHHKPHEDMQKDMENNKLSVYNKENSLQIDSIKHHRLGVPVQEHGNMDEKDDDVNNNQENDETNP